MIKAVLFDVDGVLLDSLEANYQYYIALFKKFEKKFVDFKTYKDKYYSLPVKDIIEQLIGFKGEELEKAFITAKIIPHYASLYKIPKNGKETLRKLSKKFILGIVTGRFSLDTTFSTLGLKNIFKVVVKYGDYQKAKPDPEPVLLALAKLEMKPQKVVYIGDELRDLQSAKAAGIRFICFYGVTGKIFSEADANVRAFSELSGVIKRLSWTK